MRNLIAFLTIAALSLIVAQDADAIGKGRLKAVAGKVVQRLLHPLEKFKERRESRSSSEGSYAPAPMGTPSTPSVGPKKLP